MFLLGTSGVIVLAEEDSTDNQKTEEVKSSEKDQASSSSSNDEKEKSENQDKQNNKQNENKDENKKDKSKEDKDKDKKKEDSLDFIKPAKGEFTSPYGERIHPITQVEKLHAGIDMGGGGPIQAAEDGKVVKAEYDPGWGHYVKIDHGNNVQTLYAHMKTNSIKVSEGDKVSKDQQIGTMGTTGSSTGIHLHFEVYKDGSTVDPKPLLES